MENHLFYVSPRESLDWIMQNGILTPRQVDELIKAGELPEDVRGVSSHPLEESHFPDHVSLVTHIESTKGVAQILSHNRTGDYNCPDFMAIGYEISPEVRTCPNFVDEEATKQLNDSCYIGEVLHQGPIQREHILNKFAVRPYFH